MRFQSIRIKEGLLERTINFSDGANLIHSTKNSCGKTTLSRLLLYSIGYNIPSTKRMRFDQCEVETHLYCDALGEVSVIRYNKDFLELTHGNQKSTIVLPAQELEFHKLLFGNCNDDILLNLLGTFYIDQEKGWTLLNRGTVIGSIHFNIEELIRGLSGCNCNELLAEENRLTRNISKYKQMFSIAQYRDQVAADMGSLAPESYNEYATSEIQQILFQIGGIKRELKRVDRALSSNKNFRKFVSEMNLVVQDESGNQIPVTEDNIIGLNDSVELLVSKRKMLSSDLATLENQLEQKEKVKAAENEQMSFLTSENLAEVFDKRIVSTPMNSVVIKDELDKSEKKLKSVRAEIRELTKSNNAVVMSLYTDILRYATEMGVGDDDTISPSYLFTSNLKELSGAVLHKTVFSFRLAYILAVEKELGIKLPIILDSPTGKEVDQENIKMMMSILKRDFSENQLIIASIYEYDFDQVNRIEIEDRLIPIK